MNEKTKPQNLDKWGLTENNLKKDFLPVFNLAQLKIGSSQVFTFTDAAPRMITFEDKKTGKTRKEYVIEAIDDLTKIKCTLFLSAVSLRMHLNKIWEQYNENLKDIKVKISVTEYQHEKYGTTRAYQVDVLV
jgi:hypothetical protein